jgi:hypothetical protein
MFSYYLPNPCQHVQNTDARLAYSELDVDIDVEKCNFEHFVVSLHFVPGHFVPAHFVPWSLCPSSHFVPGHVVPWSL